MENAFSIADWRQQHVRSVMLITEGDTRIKRAEDIIRDVFSRYKDPEGHPINLDADVIDKDRQVPGKSKTTLLDYLLYSIRHGFEIMSNSSVDLVPIVTKLAYRDLNYQQEDENLVGLQNLHKIVLMFLRDKSSEEYNWFVSKGADKNYDLTYREVYNYFKQKLDDQEKADTDSANNATGLVRNTHYKIIPINSMEEAEPWGKDSGPAQDGPGKLCFTHDKGMWDQFTAKGTRQCFLLLRDDWKKVPREKTEGYPKDSWGLSMVWVFIDKSTGVLGNSNVRWNHGNGTFPNVDNIFTASEISKLLGMSFKQAFGIEIDRDYLKKSIQALFEKSSTYNYNAFLEDIVPVYKGVIFKVKKTGERCYARNADNVYPIPESFTGFIKRDSKAYITKLSEEDGIEVYSFEDLRVRKGTMADIPEGTALVAYNGILAFSTVRRMWYIRNDSAVFKVPQPTYYSAQPGLRFYIYNFPDSRKDVPRCGLFDLKTMTGINMWEHFPEELFRDKETLKAIKKDRACTIVDNVPGLNGMFIYTLNVQYESQYVYLPETGSPVFSPIQTFSLICKKVLQINQTYILNRTWSSDNVLVFDAKSQTFKTFSIEEFAKYLAQFKSSDIGGFDEAKKTGVTYLGKNMCLVEGFHKMWVSNLKVSYEFDGLLNFNEKFAYFYRKHDGNSVDDLEFLRLNCNTGELETIGKGLETLHKIWTLFNGTVNVLSDDDINTLEIGKLLRIQTYKDDELGTYAILSVDKHSNQIWILKTGKILPEPGKFYYKVERADGHNILVQNTSEDTLHRISLSSENDSDSLTEISLVDLIFGKHLL